MTREPSRELEGPTDVQATSAQKRAFLNGVVLESISVLLATLIPLFLIYSAFVAITLSGDLARSLALLHGAVALGFAGLRGYIKTCRVPLALAHPLALLVTLLCWSTATFVLWHGAETNYTSFVGTILIGSGLVMLDLRWFSLTALYLLVGFSRAEPFLQPGQHITFQSLPLLAVFALGTFALLVRRTTLLRQLNLRMVVQSALRQAQATRDELDIRVEERTAELRDAYQDLSQSVAERDKIEQERCQLYEQLLHSQKMESLGRLAGGVAHDFINLLTIILGGADFARQMALGNCELDELLSGIEQAARHASEVTAQLLTFSRRQPRTTRIFDMGDQVRQSLPLLKRLVGELYTVEILKDTQARFVEADPGQFQQVILNLVVNARDAMPTGGTIEICVESTSAGAAGSKDQLGDFVVLTVSDQGRGIDPEIRHRIFEPFFTTKEMGKGTGLGLSTVDGIVSSHGGYCQAHSRPGEGTKFSCAFPATTAPPVSAKAPVRNYDSSARDGKASSRTILLAEDEPQLRAMVANYLRKRGYHVVQAANGQEALRLLQTEVNIDGIDALLSDVVMPEMDGPTLANKLWEQRPELPVLFVSGYTDDRLNNLGPKVGAAPFLAKPFDLKRLEEAVARLFST